MATFLQFYKSKVTLKLYSNILCLVAIPQLETLDVSNVDESSAELHWKMEEDVGGVYEKVTYYIISYVTGNEIFEKDIVG